MPRNREIKITKDGEEGYVLPQSLKAWERNGWTRADDGSSEPKTAETVSGEPGTPAETTK